MVGSILDVAEGEDGFVALPMVGELIARPHGPLAGRGLDYIHGGARECRVSLLHCPSLKSREGRTFYMATVLFVTM